jgi:UDP-glucose 4-epimerase
MPVSNTDWHAAYRGRRALVLGASGFIGRWVARALHQAGAQVTALVRDPVAAARILKQWEVKADLIEGDLADLSQLPALIDRAAPDITFNLAGYGIDRTERSGQLLRTINAELPGVVAGALSRHPARWEGCRLIHTGSALEYGEVGGRLEESGPVNPTTPYGITKLKGTEAVERAAISTGLPAMTARLFTVYGPGEHDGRLVPTLVAAAQHGHEVDLSLGTQRRDFTYVEDVAEGLLRLGWVRSQPVQTVNVSTGELLTVREFCGIAARVLHLRGSQLRFGALPTRPDEMAHEVVSTARCQALLGWRPATSPEAGLRATVKFRNAHTGPV